VLELQRKISFTPEPADEVRLLFWTRTGPAVVVLDVRGESEQTDRSDWMICALILNGARLVISEFRVSGDDRDLRPAGGRGRRRRRSGKSKYLTCSSTALP
jgi:hypothetical protein